jgi:hypothetical protein
LSRDNPSLRADFPLFFRCASGQASSVSGNVFRLHFHWLVHSCDCTTHVLRVERHRDGGCSEHAYGSLRPRNISVPSYRPTQTPGDTCMCASAAQVRGRGSPRSPSGPCALWTRARAGVQSHAQGQGNGPLCSSAFVDARGALGPSTRAGSTHGDPVRQQARLLSSFLLGERR